MNYNLNRKNRRSIYDLYKGREKSEIQSGRQSEVDQELKRNLTQTHFGNRNVQQ